MFSDVGVLIYVFDIESRETERDFHTYVQVIKSLEQFSPNAAVFCLIHKMDLIQIESREAVFEERRLMITRSSRSYAKGVTSYPTTIWDQSLYKAWGNIVNSLIPNMNVIEDYLEYLAESIEAQEVVLFEQSTFLAVKHVRTARSDGNLYPDRLERLSHILKTFKHSLAQVYSVLYFRQLTDPAHSPNHPHHLINSLNSIFRPLLSILSSQISPAIHVSYVFSRLVVLNFLVRG